ncbi:MAG: DNA replication and repair protein RecF [Spirochaetia bacterium]|jgi:DNA replication and repair protein RecF
MPFERLRFFNFRNLKDGELALGAPEVFLVGENGQGKTNLIEAVHLLCLGSSFREKREAAFPRDCGLPMGLHGRYMADQAGEKDFSLQCLPGRKKELRVNDKALSDRRELLADVLCVCFVQQDMEFVTGAPEERRRFFDQTLAFSDFSFLDSLRAYRQVLRSRNFCLKSRQGGLLDAYDEQLASLGLELQEKRLALVNGFNEVFSPLFREITEEEQTVEIRYVPSWHQLGTREDVLSRLAASRGRDLALGTTTSGPHRDAYSYILGGRDYSHFASTGQLRLCALALRIAQARFLTGRSGRKPVLLLDDVLLELDQAKKKAFVARFPQYEQAFFTFLPDEAYSSFATPDTLVLKVQGGEFYR